MSLITLKEISKKIGSGSTPRGGKKNYKEKGISLIRSLNVYDFEFKTKNLAFIDEIQAKKLSNVEVLENDILINITGASVGRCCFVIKDMLPARVNQHVSIIRIDRNKAIPEYVFYLINTPKYKKKIISLSQGGSTREGLTKKTIEDFEINLPEIHLQKKISSLLVNYDNLNKNNFRRIKILEDICHNIYEEWFIRHLHKKNKNQKMKNTDLGKIPEKSDIKKLREVCLTINSGGTPARNKKEYWINGKINWFKTRELWDSFVFESEEKINELGLKNSSAKLFEKKTLIMAIYGSPTVGRLGILTRDSCFNQAAIGLISNKHYLSQQFLFYVLFYLREYFNIIARGAAQQNINKEIVEEAKFILPQKKIIDEFDKVVKPIWKLIKNLKIKSNKLLNARNNFLIHYIK